MSKVFDYFDERRKMGIIDDIPPKQRVMSKADYDDMKYHEEQDAKAVERAICKRYSK